MTEDTTNNDTDEATSDGTDADDATTDDTTGDTTATDTTATDTTAANITENDPAKNKKLSEITMGESLRDLLTFEITLPGIYRGMHTNQFLWMDVGEDFYDDFYGEIGGIIGENKLNRYTGFKEGRFYIQKKTWSYDLDDGVKTELELNPYPSAYSDYMKYQLDAENQLDQSMVDVTGMGGGSVATDSTSEGGALGENAIEVGNALAAKYTFCSGAAQSYAQMKKDGCGSCWAWSGALYTELKKIGVTVRVIQYRTSQSARHMSVQYKDASGNWVDYPYRDTNIPRNARNTSSKPGCFVSLDENGNGATNIL